MKSKNKKQTLIKTAIIAGIVLFSLVVPKIVLAWDPIKDIAGGLLYRLTDFIHGFLAFLVRAGADFFEYMLNLGFKSNLDVVKTGWEVTRDFSNMFFILFMVIIAFATILRTEKYGIKQLLPKIIIIALLINFSFVIAGVIIDFSNIAANFFISDIKKYTDTSKGGISGTFADSLSLPKIQTGIDCEKERDNKIKECGGIEEKDINSTCLFKAKFWYEDCVAAQKGFFGDWANVLSLLISSTFGSMVLLVAAFTFFAGGILLIIRIVIIWFLLMFVPLVFLCYIMPGLRKMWQTWWSTFLRWCFFAPAYAFFIWLAFKVAVENQNKKLAAGVESAFSGYIAAGPGANLFTADAGQQLISYAFMIALLLGGLIAASKFGIYGADTAMKIVQKAGRGAKTWAARTTMRPVKVAGTAVGAGALTVGGKLFGGKLGRRMRARAVQFRQAAEERPEHKKYAALLKRMSPHDKLEEMKTKGIRGFMATKEVASDPKLVRTISAQKTGLVMDKLRKFGEHQAADKLEEVRLDAIKDNAEQEKVFQKVTQEGNLNKIPAIALKDERLVSAMGKFASAIQIESLRGRSPQHRDELKATLERITDPAKQAKMIKKGIQPLAKEIQQAYASQTGNISRMSNTQKTDWAKKAGPEGLKRMTTFDADIAVNIPTAQLKNTLEKMFNAAVAKDIVAHLKATPGAAAHNLAKKDPYISNLG